jgi:hypothetical protein
VVTLEWDGESGVSTLGDLLVAYWDGANWQDGAGTASGAAGSGTIPSGSSMTSFNKYTLATNPCSNPLPVELIEFTAVPVNNEVVDVNWVTASEINNDYFVIERSKNGLNFVSVDSVKSYGDGNSEETQSYSYNDENPYSGVSYYRLRQVDFDKKYSYSNIEIVNFEGLMAISLFPNPSTGQFNIIVNSSESETLKLTVFDAVGRIVKSGEFEVMEGNNQIINMLNGDSGKYLVSVVTSSGKYYDLNFVIIK